MHFPAGKEEGLRYQRILAYIITEMTNFLFDSN